MKQVEAEQIAAGREIGAPLQIVGIRLNRRWLTAEELKEGAASVAVWRADQVSAHAGLLGSIAEISAEGTTGEH